MLTPSERERIKNALLRAGMQSSEEEINAIVDNLEQLAICLHKVWVRHTRKAQNPVPPQKEGIETARSPPFG